MAHDVFISYASEDKNVADAACHHLERAGVRCWIAPRDVRPGAAWPSEIAAAIDTSRILVLILSRSCNESQQTLREVTIAVDAGKQIFPVRIHDVTPSASLRYLLSVPHWMDAMNPPLEAHLHKLTDSVRAALGLAGEGAPPPPPTPTPRSTSALRWGVGIAAAAGLAALGILLGPRLLRPTSPPAPGPTARDTPAPSTPAPNQPAPDTQPPAAPNADLDDIRAQWHAWYGSLVQERDAIRDAFGDDPAITALVATLAANPAHREAPDDLAKRPSADLDARAKSLRAAIDSFATVLGDRWEPRDRLASLAVIASQEKWKSLAEHAEQTAGALRAAREGGPPIGSMKLWLETVRDERRTLEDLVKTVGDCRADAKAFAALGPGVREAFLARMTTVLDLAAFTGDARNTLKFAQSFRDLSAALRAGAERDLPGVEPDAWAANPRLGRFAAGEPAEHADFEALLPDLRSPDFLAETQLSRAQVLTRLAPVRPELAVAPPPETPLTDEAMSAFLAAQARLKTLLASHPTLDDRTPWTQTVARRFAAAVDAWLPNVLREQKSIEDILSRPRPSPPQPGATPPADTPAKPTPQPDPAPPARPTPLAPAADATLLSRLAGKTLLSVWVYDDLKRRDYWTMQVGEARNGTASVAASGRTSDTLTATAAGDHVRISVPPYPRSRDRAWTGDLDFAAVRPADEPVVLSGLDAAVLYKSPAPKGAWYFVELPPRVAVISTLPGVRVNRGSDELLAGGRVPIDPLAANSPLKIGVAMLAKDADLRLRGDFLRFDSDSTDRPDATLKVAADGTPLWTTSIGKAKSIPLDLAVPKGTQQLELSIDRYPKPAVWNALRLEGVTARPQP